MEFQEFQLTEGHGIAKNLFSNLSSNPFFETRAHPIAQDGLELKTAMLPQLPKVLRITGRATILGYHHCLLR